MTTTYISLGSHCSVAYQLQHLKLRKCAFPFDWLRSGSLHDITQAIKNNFQDFMKVDEVQISDKFPIFEDDFTDNNTSSRIMVNKYQMKFYHDFDSDKTNYQSVTEKYERRIARFMETLASSEKICFVRDEIKMNQITINQIEEFLELILKINKNIKLLIIIYNPKNKESNILNYKNDHVTIINDTSPFEDWTRPNVDWEKLFRTF